MNRGDNFTWASWEEKIGVTTIARGYLPEEFLNTMTHLVVEEGVTELGDWVFNGMDFYDIELPKSLKKISENCREVVDASKENVRIHGYLNGKEFTVNALGAEPNILEYNYFYNIGFLFDYITDEERIKEYQMTALWH